LHRQAVAPVGVLLDDDYPAHFVNSRFSVTGSTGDSYPGEGRFAHFAVGPLHQIFGSPWRWLW